MEQGSLTNVHKKVHTKTIRNQKFLPKYTQMWPFLKSGRAECSAFCTACNSEFNIAHGGADDCRRHVNGPMHKKKIAVAEKTKSVTSYFVKQDPSNAIKAEALFAKFLIEHNIPLAAADHAGPLFKSMFTDSKIAAQYNAGRTKTTAMISLMAAETSKTTASQLNVSPFAFSTDASNDGGSETLFPIVVRYFDEMIEVLSTVLCIASNTDSSTGKNIFSLIDEEFEKQSVSWQKCIAFGCDNASVMTGKYNGVSKYIREKQAHIFIMGCYCHLMHLAAQKAAAELPHSVDELLIDIYFYLNKSTKRQQALKHFQALCGVESRKIIKHASTRWLSLEMCIKRLLEQWEPLSNYFKSEHDAFEKKKKKVDSEKRKRKFAESENKEGKNAVSGNKKSKIAENTKRKSFENNQSKIFENLNCADSLDNIKQKKNVEHNSNEPKEKCNKKQTHNKKDELPNRLERIYSSLHNPETKFYCLFLKNVLPVFTKKNELLMSSAPLIQKLRRILLDLLSDIYARFLKANAISKAKDIFSIDIELKNNHRDNDTIVIGSEGKAYLNFLKSEGKLSEYDMKNIFKRVKNFYIASAKYIVASFDLKNPLLQCAEVADIALRKSVPFSHVTFFLSKFGHLFDETQRDTIETQFFRYQFDDFSDDILNCNRIDLAWYKISQLKDASGEYKYDMLSKIIKMVLVIPHSNAEDERIFSIVRKNLNEYRPNLSSTTLSNLIVEKMNTLSKHQKCYNSHFSEAMLVKLKSAAYNSLK